jgi:hypothetical protein
MFTQRKSYINSDSKINENKQVEALIAEANESNILNLKRLFFQTDATMRAVLLALQNTIHWQDIHTVITYQGVALPRPTGLFAAFKMAPGIVDFNRKHQDSSTYCDQEKAKLLAECFEQYFNSIPTHEADYLIQFIVKYHPFLGVNINNEGLKIFIDQLAESPVISQETLKKFAIFYHQFQVKWTKYIDAISQENKIDERDIVILTSNESREYKTQADEIQKYFSNTHRRVVLVNETTELPDPLQFIWGYSRNRLYTDNRQGIDDAELLECISFLNNQLVPFANDQRMEMLRRRVGRTQSIICLNIPLHDVRLNQDVRKRKIYFHVQWDALVRITHRYKLSASICLMPSDTHPTELEEKSVDRVKFIEHAIQVFEQENSFQRIWDERLKFIDEMKPLKKWDGMIQFNPHMNSEEKFKLIDSLWSCLLRTISQISMESITNSRSVINDFSLLFSEIIELDAALFEQKHGLESHINLSRHKSVTIWSGSKGLEAALSNPDNLCNLTIPLFNLLFILWEETYSDNLSPSRSILDGRAEDSNKHKLIALLIDTLVGNNVLKDREIPSHFFGSSAGSSDIELGLKLAIFISKLYVELFSSKANSFKYFFSPSKYDSHDCLQINSIGWEHELPLLIAAGKSVELFRVNASGETSPVSIRQVNFVRANYQHTNRDSSCLSFRSSFSLSMPGKDEWIFWNNAPARPKISAAKLSYFFHHWKKRAKSSNDEKKSHQRSCLP